MGCRFVLRSGLVLQPDTAVRLTHNSEAEATTHPVEDGGSIADHVVLKPNAVSIETLWTPRPGNDTFQPSGEDRPVQAFDFLSAVLQGREPLRIEVDGEVYTPAVLTSVRMNRGFEDGDGRTIQIEATQVQIVSGQTVNVKVAQKIKGTAKKKAKTVVPITGSAAILAGAEAIRGDWIGALAILAE